MLNMHADEQNLLKRLSKTQEELRRVRQDLDQTISNPERNDQDVEDLLTAHSAVVLECQALHQQKVLHLERLLDTLQRCNVIGKYARVNDVVQLQVGRTEVAVPLDDLLPFLQGLVHGCNRSLGEETEIERVELPVWARAK